MSNSNGAVLEKAKGALDRRPYHRRKGTESYKSVLDNCEAHTVEHTRAVVQNVAEGIDALAARGEEGDVNPVVGIVDGLDVLPNRFAYSCEHRLLEEKSRSLLDRALAKSIDGLFEIEHAVAVVEIVLNVVDSIVALDRDGSVGRYGVTVDIVLDLSGQIEEAEMLLLRYLVTHVGTRSYPESSSGRLLS